MIIVADALRSPNDQYLLWSLCIEFKDEACQCDLSHVVHYYSPIISGQGGSAFLYTFWETYNADGYGAERGKEFLEGAGIVYG